MGVTLTISGDTNPPSNQKLFLVWSELCGPPFRGVFPPLVLFKFLAGRELDRGDLLPICDPVNIDEARLVTLVTTNGCQFAIA